MKTYTVVPVSGRFATSADWAWASWLGVPSVDLLCTGGRRGLAKKPAAANWREHQTTAAEIAQWAANPHLNCAVNCRTIRAIDIDIETPALVDALIAEFERIAGGQFLIRGRPNSTRVLVPFRLEGTLQSLVLEAGRDGNVELLANGKCFVLAGKHPSGVRYTHRGISIPTLSHIQLDAYLATVAKLLSNIPEQRPSQSVLDYTSVVAAEVGVADTGIAAADIAAGD